MLQGVCAFSNSKGSVPAHRRHQTAERDQLEFEPRTLCVFSVSLRSKNIVYTPGQPKVRLPCGHTTYDIRQSHPRVRVTPRSRCRCPNIHDLHSYAMPMQCGPRSCLWAASLASSCCTRRICNGFSPSSSLKSSSVRPPSISPLTMFSLKAEQTASAKPRSRRANPLASPLGQGL